MAASGARSSARGVGGWPLLVFYQFLGVLGYLGQVLVQLRMRLTF